jgi:peptide-methionine (S)-S-oxide reductase
VEGILETIVGYSGSKDPKLNTNPTYKNIKDYAETILIRYDPNKVDYIDTLNMFFSFHTPENPSWCGTQYRSAIFTFSKEQNDFAHAMVKEWGALGRFVSIEDASDFYRAEEYHQKYLQKM